MVKKKPSTPLENEIRIARKKIVTDGYDMSVGEVMNLYRDRELTIDPVFQRLFRWDLTRKSRFIESLLLGIPIPPIFVYQDPEGVWELVDGLQRLSTILEFVGELRVSKSKDDDKDETNNLRELETDDNENVDDDVEKYKKPSVLCGTKLLPSLEGKKWDLKERRDSIGLINQIAIKRARIRIEILKAESDENAKFELFQRLNTGGSPLSEQEVRNCVAVMVNKKFYNWLVKAASFKSFITTTSQTQVAMEKQASVELVLRMVAFQHVKYDGRQDVHEYLDNALLQLARNTEIDWEVEKTRFEATFALLDSALEDSAFKKWDGGSFKGKFLMSLFEVVGFGVSKNLEAILELPKPIDFLKKKAKSVWSEETFITYSGAGIRGTTRLTKLLPFSVEFFKP
jgi:uncharacterized protein with ParB-like and HNH nuclease domain